MNLWEIAEEIERTFAQAVDPETGEINEEYMAQLDALEMDRDRKIENVACFIKNLRADAAAIKAEKDALQKRQKAAESKAESLTRYLSNFLNGEKYASPRAAITWRRSTRVEFDPGKSALDIDTHYLRLKDPELDKTKAAADLKAGIEIPGLHLEDTLSMTIK